jgi:hypothetical protein
MYPFLKKLFADGGYQGPTFQKTLANILPALEIEIVRRPDQAKSFVVLQLIPPQDTAVPNSERESRTKTRTP